MHLTRMCFFHPKAQGSQVPSIPWYNCVPVGKSKLSSTVKDICNEAGIADKTKHSLRATGATGLL